MCVDLFWVLYFLLLASLSIFILILHRIDSCNIILKADSVSPPTSFFFFKVQFTLVAQSYPNLCDRMDRSTPGLPVHHQLLEPTQTHVHWVGVAIQPSHPLSSPSPPTFNLSQHQGRFQWVSSSHQEARVLELQLQHQFFQWIFKTDFL